jgi:enamine deaminase RidA (YjgF/YER057c/UK114 family)
MTQREKQENYRMSVRRIDVGPRMSQAVVHGNTVYLAGQVAADPKADVTGQTEQILAQIDKLLKEAGTDKTKILSANVWLADIKTFADMNKAWDAWVPKGNTPARATVEAKLAAPDYKVEIACIAAIS